MGRKAFLIAAALAGLWLTPSIGAEATGSDYSRDEAWLCRPGRADVCGKPASIATIAPDGQTRIEPLPVAADPPLDCFYVYPTISEDPADISPLAAGPGELRVASDQFRPFASVCKPFAPLYRQVTIAGLQHRMRGQAFEGDKELGYDDVLAAWRYYLAHDNSGRRVVLIGHSQGSRVLIELMRHEIDGKPDQARIAGALILGYNVEVPPGRDVGGTFQHIPVCGAPGQSGCVVAYESFRSTATPIEGARIGFGFARTSDRTLACVDPVKLSGQPLQMAIPLRTNILGQPSDDPQWRALAQTTAADFADLPGLLTAHCVQDGDEAYLSVELAPEAKSGRRPSNIPGDFVVRGRELKDWGLHLIDVNLAMGNLIVIVRGWK